MYASSAEFCSFPFEHFQKVVKSTGFALILLGLCSAIACKTGVKKDQPVTSIKDKSKTDMPIQPLPTPPGDYADEWRIVDSLQQQGLFKSALEKTEAIYAHARIDHNSPQSIKALIFKGKFTTQLEEDGIVKAIEMFEKNTAEAAPPERSVLQSLTAELYATYLRNQGWRIANRTETTPAAEDKNTLQEGWLLTASAAQIERRALDLYAASVEPLASVQAASADAFRDILTPGQNDSIGGKPLRPSLYDLLAHRAIEHFSNERSYLTEPAYAFQFDQAAAFAPVEDFLKTTFETKDLESGKWLAVKTFQKVLSQYVSSNTAQGNLAAALDADLDRLRFARNTSSLENKLALYRQALEALHKQYYDHSMDGEIVFDLAGLVYRLETGDKGANARFAVAALEDAIRRHPETFGAQQCQLLLREIQAVFLQTEVEKVSLPGRSTLVSLQFTNLKTAYVRVVHIPNDPGVWEKIRRGQEGLTDEQWLKRQKPVQTRTWKITAPDDYQPHRTEIALDPLPLGSYWLLVSANADFDAPDVHAEAFSAFTVSNLAAVQYDAQGKTTFVAVNRTSGASLKDVKFDFFQQDYRTGQMERRWVSAAMSDADGFAQVSLPENNVFEARASLGADTLWVGNASSYRHTDDYVPPMQAQFFTDRSIYRPGQTIYFKGIAFQLMGQGSRKLPQIAPNKKVSVRLYDVNGQPKAALDLRTNEFGTFNGAFTAPASGLTGPMSIRCDDLNGQADFSVEEYKRPKFEVTTKPIEGSFRLNEKVTVRGEAKNYAGSAVGEAQVRYRVTRWTRFPFWDWGWTKRPPYNTSPQEIANGTLMTDANGLFVIDFMALPDLSIPKKDQPMFDYEVSADVTDITGETRSTLLYVAVGYVALKVDWNLPNDAELDSLRNIQLTTTNLAGQPQAAAGEITLQRLTAPATPYIHRYWEKPDVAMIPKPEFNRLFPDYAFMDEEDPMKWEREGSPRSVLFNTADSKTADLNGGRLQPGSYLVKLTTKDAYGEPVALQKVVRVFDSKKPATRFTTPDNFVEKNNLEPGQTARIWVGSQAPMMHLLLVRQLSDHETDKLRWFPVRGADKIEIPVTEADRGGIVLHGVAVLNNRIYGPGQIRVEVPWSNKDLTIRYETFRDKLAPGQQEQWLIKISGPKKEKVAAEMVAALYDASLDQFRPHEWGRIEFPARYGPNLLSGNETFAAEGGYGQIINDAGQMAPSRSYPGINWFDFPFWGGGPGDSRPCG